MVALPRWGSMSVSWCENGATKNICSLPFIFPFHLSSTFSAPMSEGHRHCLLVVSGNFCKGWCWHEGLIQLVYASLMFFLLLFWSLVFRPLIMKRQLRRWAQALPLVAFVKLPGHFSRLWVLWRLPWVRKVRRKSGDWLTCMLTYEKKQFVLRQGYDLWMGRMSELSPPPPLLRQNIGSVNWLLCSPVLSVTWCSTFFSQCWDIGDLWYWCLSHLLQEVWNYVCLEMTTFRAVVVPDTSS